MLRKLPVLLMVGALIGLMVLPAAVQAGGWAVVTLDQMPDTITAGQPFTIGFMVRQHGKTPVDGLTPTITLRSSDPGVENPVITQAKPDGAIGHYVATITLPQAGSWTWAVETFGPIAEMSPLTVAAPATAPAPIRVTESIQVWAWSVAATLLIAGGGLLLTLRARRRIAARA